MSIDSATDGEVFLAYVGNILVPSLRVGDIVILDNLGAHKGAGGYPFGRRDSGISPCLFPRPQPDREDVEQDQGDTAGLQGKDITGLEYGDPESILLRYPR